MDDSFLSSVLSVTFDIFKSVWGILKETLGTAFKIGKQSLNEYRRWK